MLEDGLLPISAVAVVRYCPRNFYYRMIEEANDSNYHVLEGSVQEAMREDRLSQNRGDVRQVTRVELVSILYGIYAILCIYQCR